MQMSHISNNSSLLLNQIEPGNRNSNTINERRNKSRNNKGGVSNSDLNNDATSKHVRIRRESHQGHTFDILKPSLLPWGLYIRLPLLKATENRIIEYMNSRPSTIPNHARDYIHDVVMSQRKSPSTAKIHLSELACIIERPQYQTGNAPGMDMLKTIAISSMPAMCKGEVATGFIDHIKGGRYAFILGKLSSAEYSESTHNVVGETFDPKEHGPLGPWYILGSLVIGDDLARLPRMIPRKVRQRFESRSFQPRKGSRIATVSLLCSNIGFGKMLLETVETHLHEKEEYDDVALWSLSKPYSFYVDKCGYAPIDLATGRILAVRRSIQDKLSVPMAYPFFSGDSPQKGYFLAKHLGSGPRDLGI